MPDTCLERTEDQQLFLQKEEELAKLREQRHELCISNNRQQSEIQSHIQRQAHVERWCEQLQKMSSIQHRELQTCKDNLFRLQPIIQLTDSDISKQYETLCQQVSSWVDDGISRFEDKHGYHANDAIITDGVNTHIRRLLDSAPAAGEYLVSTAIHQHIQGRFFGGNVILVGLCPRITEFLHSTEEQMAKLEPRRDAITINEWRSETLNAVATTPELIQSRNSKVERFTDRLFHFLEMIFPGIIDEQKSKSRLHQDVSRYAAQLEASIHQSSTKYRFQPMHGPGHIYERVTTSMLTSSTWIDVETRKTLKPDSLVTSDRDGYIGRTLMLIEPGLERYDAGGRRWCIRPSKYLIKLDTPLSRRALDDLRK
ncbi:hypothetical protein MMC29_004958 [Sticta canariensis]|nr:hypothetical protein [Sticta canariensis]